MIRSFLVLAAAAGIALPQDAIAVTAQVVVIEDERGTHFVVDVCEMTLQLQPSTRLSRVSTLCQSEPTTYTTAPDFVPVHGTKLERMQISAPAFSRDRDDCALAEFTSTSASSRAVIECGAPLKDGYENAASR